MILKPRKRAKRQKVAPWLRPGSDTLPAFTPVRVAEGTFDHWFGVCLYSEPTYQVMFPERNFALRYVHNQAQTAEVMERMNARVKLFVDESMLETALGFSFADVYLVQEPRLFPFSQHIWRYFACLLPGAQDVKAIHFRGMDNLTFDDPQLITQFLASGADLLHAPYCPTRGFIIPVRGSCSVANDGVAALGYFLRNRILEEPGPLWIRATFHNDELHLLRFYREMADSLSLYTYIDRKLPPGFYTKLAERLTHGRPTHVHCVFSGVNGPLRTPPLSGPRPSSDHLLVHTESAPDGESHSPECA